MYLNSLSITTSTLQEARKNSLRVLKAADSSSAPDRIGRTRTGEDAENVIEYLQRQSMKQNVTQVGRNRLLHCFRPAARVCIIHRQHRGTDNTAERPSRNSGSLFPSLFVCELGCPRSLALRHNTIVYNSPRENREARATPPGVRNPIGRGLGDSLCRVLVLGQLAG